MPLTRRQREILDYLSGYIGDHGYAPSFEEIARQFGFASLATVHEHLTNLERKSYIRRNHNESRAIEIVPPKGQTGATEIPLLGLVAAGQPIEAVTGDETLAVPDELLPRPVVVTPHEARASLTSATRSAREWPWLFALCVLGLAGEWVARRRLGLR